MGLYRFWRLVKGKNMSNYPKEIDNKITLPYLSQNDTISVKHANQINAAIKDIQGVIGVSPRIGYPIISSSSGTNKTEYTNVIDYLNNIKYSIESFDWSGVVKVNNNPNDGDFVVFDGSNWVWRSDFYNRDIVFIKQGGVFGFGKTKEIDRDKYKVTSKSFFSNSAHSKNIYVKNLRFQGISTAPDVVSFPSTNINQNIKLGTSIYFDKSLGKLMISNGNGTYRHILENDPANVTAQFTPSKDLFGDNSYQRVVGIQGIEVESFQYKRPIPNLPLKFDGIKYVLSSNFGLSDIQTASIAKSKNIKVGSFANSPGAISSDANGNLYSGKIFNRNINTDSLNDPSKRLDGKKINPNFNNQNIITNKNIISKFVSSKRIYFGDNQSSAILSGSAFPASTQTDGTLFLKDDGKVYISKNNNWSQIPSAMGGSAGGDLSGNYPNPTVKSINGAFVPPASQLKDGYVLQVKDKSSLMYGPINLSGNPSANYVVGILPESNQDPQKMYGDVIGTTANAVVVSILGTRLSDKQPVAGNYLRYDSLSNIWFPSDLKIKKAPSGAASGDLSGSYPSPIVSKINGSSVPPAVTFKVGNALTISNASLNELTYSPIQLNNVNSVIGKLPIQNQSPQALSGDATGFTNNVKIEKINGIPISNNQKQDGYYLIFDGNNWSPQKINSTFEPTGEVFNDLSGFFDDNYGPVVVGINGADVPRITNGGDFSSGNLLMIESLSSQQNSRPALKYGPIDLSDPEMFSGLLSKDKQESQIMSGDVSGETSLLGTTVVNKIRNRTISQITQESHGKFLQVQLNGYLFGFGYPKLQEMNGFIRMPGLNRPPPVTQDTAALYYDRFENKLKISENGGLFLDIKQSNINTKKTNIVNMLLSSAENKFTANYNFNKEDELVLFKCINSNSNSAFEASVVLPSSSVCSDGQIFTAVISPYTVGASYSIYASVSNQQDTLSNASINNFKCTFILDKINKKWSAINANY